MAIYLIFIIQIKKSVFDLLKTYILNIIMHQFINLEMKNIKEVSLESIMNSIKNNQNIGKDDRQNIYNIYKTNDDLKNITIDYDEYKEAMKDIEKLRNVDITKDYSDEKPSTSKIDRNKSLIPKLKSNLSKTIVENIIGQGYNKIKIDTNLLKKNILKLDIFQIIEKYIMIY